MAGSLVIATQVPPAPTPRPVLLNSDPYLDRIARPFARVMRIVSGGSDPGSLSGRAAQSGVWIGGGFVIQRVLQLGSNLILTRLLFPEAFGLMALATIFLVGLAMFSDLRIKPAIIRDPRGNDPDFLNTAWTLQVIRGFILFAGGCLIAYPVSLFYEQPILFPLLLVLSTTSAIAGFQSIRMITAERDLKFRLVIAVQLIGQAVTVVTLVGLAYFWQSIWALAAGNVVGNIAGVTLSHVLLRGQRHRFRLEPEATRSIIHFGKWIFLSTIVTFLGGEGLRAIQGSYVTPAEFGVLAVAYTISAIPAELALKLTGSIGLPALSEAYRSSPDRMASVLHQFRKRLLGVSFVMIAAVAFVSEPLIELLYDSRYHDAGGYVVALVLANGMALVFTGYLNALVAAGRSKSYMIFMTVVAVSRILGLTIGFKFSGIYGMIVGVGIANFFVLVVSWINMYRYKFINIKLDIVSVIVILLISIWFL